MFKPIFRHDRLQGFSVVIAHHCDMGGRVPGSNASDSTEIYQEGLRIPPLKLFEAGKPNRTLFDIITKNVRLPDLVVGDLEAQLATCFIGERELGRLIDRYGEAELQRYFDELLDYGERLTRQAIRAWPNGTYTFTDFIDDDGFDETPIPIKATVTVEDAHLRVDFAGSAPQVRGAINCTPSYVKSATYLAIRCVLSKDVPNNAGVYRCIDVAAPKGSIVNPELPAAVAARALTGYRVVDTVMGALAQIAPERVVAAGEGGNTVVCFGGYDRRTREPFILVDMINGAWGARADKDGIEGVTNPSQNMSNMPVETLEAQYPIRIEEYAYRPDSCGAGRMRGGLGLIREYRLLAEEAILQLRSDRYRHRPYGLFGGGPAAPSLNVLNPAAEHETLASKVTRTVRRGDVVRHEQAGGGGYGDPLTRAPALVAADMLDGKITRAFARAQFGVVFEGNSETVDAIATAACRRAMAGRSIDAGSGTRAEEGESL
jgi:N-methylhydantoinase B